MTTARIDLADDAPESQIDLTKLAQASRKAALLSTFGAMVFFSALGYSSWRIQAAQAELADISGRLAIAVGDLVSAQAHLSTVQSQTSDLRAELTQLEDEQLRVVTTLGEVLQAEKIEILDPDIHFADIRSDFDAIKPGRRKQAMLAAILFAWKSVPFATGGKDLTRGIGSIEFLLEVLGQVGIKITAAPGMLRSDSVMKSMAKVETPQVGDIAIYRGSVGSYGVFVISLGATSGGPIGLGGYNERLPVQIRSLSKGDRAKHPFLGYYRPNYDSPKDVGNPR